MLRNNREMINSKPKELLKELLIEKLTLKEKPDGLRELKPMLKNTRMLIRKI